MSQKYICVHGHFYQPPRENPWLNKVEIQDSAYPYHDWNHRINAECYSRNVSSRILDAEGKVKEIMNNYASISFNVGPTLLEWMENEAPETYAGILAADRESQERFSGHGAALAQAYNHLIMPLANKRDKETQVIWGIQDFKSRFKRMPEGMWLGETAVNTETLEVLAEHGIKFTILSPYQAKRMRKIGKEKWTDATNAKVEPKKAYVCNLPSGKQINLFFYDGPASQAVAFEGLLDDGARFAKRLEDQFIDRDEVQLVHIATDGESYGHHHELGEMALSYCLDSIAKDEKVKLTIYGEFLEKFPPQYEVEIAENTSWSCYHGVERWRSDCGCNTGGHPDWNQKWRAPLRESFDWIREKLIELYEKEMKAFTDDPWEVRNAYIEVVLNRDEDNVRKFLQAHFGDNLKKEEQTKLLKLLEMQYHAMLMYTSCGWFFDEVTGIESMQDIFYATRALQLGEEVSGNSYEEDFEKHLSSIPSNLAEYDSALTAFEKFVKPMKIDMIRIGAHYAVSSLFEEFPDEVSLYNFKAKVLYKKYYQAAKQKLVIGHTEITSEVTWEKVDISYAVVHLGEHHLFGGVREFIGDEALQEVQKSVGDFFRKGNVYEIFNLMDTYFGTHNYSFWHLFRDEQENIMELIMENTLKSAEGAMQQVYDNSYQLLQTFQQIHMKVPSRLQIPANLAINNRLIRILKEEHFDLAHFKRLLSSAALINIELDIVTLNYLSDQKLNAMMRGFRENCKNIDLLLCINEFLVSLKVSPIQPQKWEAQNIAFELRDQELENEQHAAEQGDEEAKTWTEAFEQLTANLNLA